MATQTFSLSDSIVDKRVDDFFAMLRLFNEASTFEAIESLLDRFGRGPRELRKAQQCREHLMFQRELELGHTCLNDVESPMMPEVYPCD